MCFAFPFHVFWKQQENAELKIATIRMREIAKSQFLSFLFELNQLGNFPEVGEGGGKVRAKFRARFSHFLFFFFFLN